MIPYYTLVRTTCRQNKLSGGVLIMKSLQNNKRFISYLKGERFL